ncbi:hypothetical protein [Propionigenium maris]|nr:hypothetical protein [Propionigenium maris]
MKKMINILVVITAVIFTPGGGSVEMKGIRNLQRRIFVGGSCVLIGG